MTTETELIFSPERTSSSTFHVFSSKKVRWSIGQRVLLHFCFLASSGKSTGSGHSAATQTCILPCLSLFHAGCGSNRQCCVGQFEYVRCRYACISSGEDRRPLNTNTSSVGKSILHQNNNIHLLGRMLRTSRVPRPWFVRWGKNESTQPERTCRIARCWQVYKVRYKEDDQLYAIKRSLTKFRGKSDR